jgi:hypothetical protein
MSHTLDKLGCVVVDELEVLHSQWLGFALRPRQSAVDDVSDLTAVGFVGLASEDRSLQTFDQTAGILYLFGWYPLKAVLVDGNSLFFCEVPVLDCEMDAGLQGNVNGTDSICRQNDDAWKRSVNPFRLL